MQTSNLLQGENVRLTAVTREDLPTIARWYENSNFGRHFDASPAYPRSAEQWEKWLKDEQDKQTAFLFGIRLVEGKELLGYVEIDDILWPHRNGWLAMGIGEEENWGKGYGREALALALHFAFQELNLHRVQLTVFSYNQRAIHLYEKIGFQREGVFREHLQRDGRRHDMVLYGLLRPEWESRAN